MKSSTRTFALAFAALAAAAMLAGLAHLVLVATGTSEPAATTVHGPTARRLWATTAGALALAGVVVGVRVLARSTRTGNEGRLGAIFALISGLVAAINGGLVLAVAGGGPGSGNGVVGGAGALVLGVVGMALGAITLRRSHRAPETSQQGFAASSRGR